MADQVVNVVTADNLTGTLAVANGGTGSGTAGGARTNLGLGTIATQAASSVAITGGSISGITDLAVADGGTGAGTFAANGVLYGNGTSAIQVTAQGAANTVLTANAGAPSFSASPVIGTSVTVPTLYGSSSASGNVAVQSTSNSTRGKVQLADQIQAATTAQAVGTTSGFVVIDVATGGVTVTTGNVSVLKFGGTVTVGGNSGSTLASLFNAQYTTTDDGTSRTVGPSLTFAASPTFQATVASGLTVNDLVGIPAAAGVYWAPAFSRTGSGTGTATTAAAVYVSKFAQVNTGWTVTNYCGLLIDVPSTLTGTISNFYGVKNNGAAATNFWFLYETGGMQSSHKGNLRIGDNTAPTAALDVQGTINTNQTTANGSVATSLGSVGPTGSHTTVQEWLTIKINGTTRYLPCF